MKFTKRLREPVKRGEVTCSIRVWQSPRVKPGVRYQTGFGQIEIIAIREISLQDVTPELARRSGFLGLVDLLKVAKHGPASGYFWWSSSTWGPDEAAMRRQWSSGVQAGAPERTYFLVAS